MVQGIMSDTMIPRLTRNIAEDIAFVAAIVLSTAGGYLSLLLA